MSEFWRILARIGTARSIRDHLAISMHNLIQRRCSHECCICVTSVNQLVCTIHSALVSSLLTAFFCHRHGLSTVIAKTPANLMYRRSKHWNLEITDTRRFLWVFFGWEWCFCAKNLGLRLPYETRKTKTTWRSNRNIQDTDWKRTCQLQQILWTSRCHQRTQRTLIEII